MSKDPIDTEAGRVRIAAPPFPKKARPPVSTKVKRRSPVSLAGAGVSLSFAEVDNPCFSAGHRESATNPRKVRVERNSNESPLVALEARGTIDVRQARAGHHVRMLHERVTMGRGSASFLRERVDGGGRADGFTDGRAAAARQLGKMADEIGPAPFRLLIAVCGDGRSLTDLTREAARRKGAIREELRHALDLAAKFLGLGEPPKAGRHA